MAKLLAHVISKTANKWEIDRLFLQEAKLMRVKYNFGAILFMYEEVNEFLPSELRSNK